MELDDPVAEPPRRRVSDILDSNLIGPAALLEAFKEVQEQLDAAGGSGGHLDAWLAGEHSLQETEAEIERLLQVTSWRCSSVLHVPCWLYSHGGNYVDQHRRAD